MHASVLDGGQGTAVLGCNNSNQMLLACACAGTASLEKPPPKVTNSDGGTAAHKENSGLVLPPRNEW